MDLRRPATKRREAGATVKIQALARGRQARGRVADIRDPDSETSAFAADEEAEKRAAEDAELAALAPSEEEIAKAKAVQERRERRVARYLQRTSGLEDRRVADVLKQIWANVERQYTSGIQGVLRGLR